MIAILSAAKEISVVDAAPAAVFTIKMSNQLHQWLLRRGQHALAGFGDTLLKHCKEKRESGSNNKKMVLFSMIDVFVQLGRFVSLFLNIFYPLRYDLMGAFRRTLHLASLGTHLLFYVILLH